MSGTFTPPKGLRVRTAADAVEDARMDPTTRALAIIDYPHKEVHAGDSFVVTDVQSVSTTTMQWQITTPNSAVYAHTFFRFDGTGEIYIVVTEGSDRVDGTALAEINRRRVGTPAEATVIVTRTPTGGNTDGAVTIYSHRSGATGLAAKTIAGGDTRGENEFILKPNTKYVVSITTYAAIHVTFHVNWYEHTDLG